MSPHIRSWRRRLTRRNGANPALLGIAGVLALLLLALYVQTLHVAIARGEVLRAQQRATLRAPDLPLAMPTAAAPTPR